MMKTIKTNVPNCVRIECDGDTALRAYEYADSVTGKGLEKETRDSLLAMFREQYPESMRKAEKGSKVPTGWYVFESFRTRLTEFVLDQVNQRVAAERAVRGAFYGSALAKGKIALRVVLESGARVYTNENIHELKPIVDDMAVEIVELRRELSEQMDLNLKISKDRTDLIARVRALTGGPKLVPPVPVPATAKKEKRRGRSINGTLVFEEWKCVVGADPAFMFSNFGRFKNAKTGKSIGLHFNRQKLALVSVSTTSGGRNRQMIINAAKEVALGFCGVPERGMYLHFHDGNRANVAAHNLCWIRENDPRRTPADIVHWSAPGNHKLAA